MKIALVFSGQPRFVDKESYHSIKKHLLDKYDCDTYAHFWFIDDGKTSFETAPWSNLGRLVFHPDTISIFQKLYHPVRVEFEPPLKDQDLTNKIYSNTNNPRTPYNTLSLFTSHKKAFSLIKDASVYDFIIRIRTDDVIFRLPDLTTLNKNKNHLVVQAPERRIFNDSFAIFVPEDAKLFFKSVDIIDTLYENGILFNNEEMFGGVLDFYKITQRSERFSLKDFNFGYVRNGYVEFCQNEI